MVKGQLSTEVLFYVLVAAGFLLVMLLIYGIIGPGLSEVNLFG